MITRAEVLSGEEDASRVITKYRCDGEKAHGNWRMPVNIVGNETPPTPESRAPQIYSTEPSGMKLTLGVRSNADI